MVQKKKIFTKNLFAIILGLFITIGCVSGVARITIIEPQKGDIDFPHKLHQKALNNCDACHSLFPKKIGSIKMKIDNRELRKKEVMNTCVKCHRKMKKKKLKAGPTSCKGCHLKKK